MPGPQSFVLGEQTLYQVSYTPAPVQTFLLFGSFLQPGRVRFWPQSWLVPHCSYGTTGSSLRWAISGPLAFTSLRHPAREHLLGWLGTVVLFPLGTQAFGKRQGERANVPAGQWCLRREGLCSPALHFRASLNPGGHRRANPRMAQIVWDRGPGLSANLNIYFGNQLPKIKCKNDRRKKDSKLCKLLLQATRSRGLASPQLTACCRKRKRSDRSCSHAPSPAGVPGPQPWGHGWRRASPFRSGTREHCRV